METRGCLATETQSAAAGALAALLRERGLIAAVQEHGVVMVSNPAAEQSAGDQADRALGPGLRQEVRCARGPGGAAWWFWVWWDATGQCPPELEPLCPADQPESAAARIATVLAMSPAPHLAMSPAQRVRR
ncbi:hypothetical protein ACFYYL_38735 [Actinomadura geliboluensis]|uniref:hypothetical protein n=1 Tax=Actinomadura geliboluensis TaxID=882440 RepID=UPI0036A72447